MLLLFLVTYANTESAIFRVQYGQYIALSLASKNVDIFTC